MAMENINWNYPTSIWFGLDRIKEIQKECDNLNIKNPLIVTDPGILQTDIINKINPSFVYHLAAFAGPPRNEKNPQFARKYNVDLTKKLLSCLDSNSTIFFPSTDKIFEGSI